MCDKKDLSIVCVVELDDRSHRSENRKIKDAEKDYALKSAAIPLMRLPVDLSYLLSEIKLKILGEIGNSAIAQSSLELLCPKCSTHTVARLAKTGVHKENYLLVAAVCRIVDSFREKWEFCGLTVSGFLKL